MLSSEAWCCAFAHWSPILLGMRLNLRSDTRSSGAAPVAAPAAPGPAPAAPPHGHVENVISTCVGIAIAALGVYLMQAAGLVTGGTAGAALLVSHVAGWAFGPVFLGITLPFMVLAISRKGWPFTIRTIVCVVAMSALVQALPHVLTIERIDPVFGAIVGNTLASVALVVLFRHGASLGGFNVLALIAQERLGWRAGYVQLVLDGLVVGIFALLNPGWLAVLSLLGAAVMNILLAFNHRPGRYLGA